MTSPPDNLLPSTSDEYVGLRPRRRNRSRVIVCLAVTGILLVVAVILVVTWPAPFVSKEVELTGVEFTLETVVEIDATGNRGEGQRVIIYSIPEKAATKLAARKAALSQYPMWTGLAFDGYERIRWTEIQDCQNAKTSNVLNTITGPCNDTNVKVGKIATLPEALAFANQLTQRPGTLVGGWHRTDHDQLVTDYFIYLLNIKERTLVKVLLLT